MERINLNVPTALRRRLRGIAKRRGCTEAAAARDLLEYALERLDKDEFLRRVAAAQTAENRKRQLQILAAFESMDDSAR